MFSKHVFSWVFFYDFKALMNLGFKSENLFEPIPNEISNISYFPSGHDSVTFELADKFFNFDL